MYVLLFIHLRIDLAHDVFGRERHRLHKDDMGGIGTFDKECRTLYVGGLGNRSTLEKLLWIEFGEWGEIEVTILFVLIGDIITKSMCLLRLVNKLWLIVPVNPWKIMCVF